jgi:hypothetical protein
LCPALKGESRLVPAKHDPTVSWANWTMKMKLSKELYTRVNRDFERNGLVTPVTTCVLCLGEFSASRVAGKGDLGREVHTADQSLKARLGA